MDIKQQSWMKTPDYKLEFSYDTYSYYSVKGIYSECLKTTVYFKRKSKRGQIMEQIAVEEFNSIMKEYVKTKEVKTKDKK